MKTLRAIRQTRWVWMVFLCCGIALAFLWSGRVSRPPETALAASLNRLEKTGVFSNAASRSPGAAAVYVLEGIDWSFKKTSPPWSPGDIAATGSEVALENPLGGSLEVKLILPQTIASNAGYVANFEVTASGSASIWATAITGLDGADSNIQDYSAGVNKPAVLRETITCRVVGEDSSTVVTAYPETVDHRAAYDLEFCVFPLSYPTFRIKLDSNGTAMLSAYPRWKYLGTEVPLSGKVYANTAENDWLPLTGALVQLWQGDDVVEQTSAMPPDGHYFFGEAPDGGDLKVRAVLSNTVGDETNFAVVFKGGSAWVETATFAGRAAPIVKDIIFDSTAVSHSFGAEKNLLADVGMIFYYTRRAWEQAERMLPEQSQDDEMRIKTFEATGDAAWYGPSTLAPNPFDPYIQFGPSASLQTDSGIPDNREYHEYGHQFMADALGNLFPVANGETNHWGYYNASTSDAWTEGFAEFFSMMVSKNIDHELTPYMYRFSGASTSLETNYRSFPERYQPAAHTDGILEEMAVAGLLWDLVDEAEIEDDLTITMTIGGGGVITQTLHDHLAMNEATLWGVLFKNWRAQISAAPAAPADYRYIFDMHNLYEALKEAYIGQGTTDGASYTDLDELFILHGFFTDVNGNKYYDAGETVSLTSNGSGPGRRDLQPETGSFIQFTAQDTETSDPVVVTSFLVEVTFPPGDEYFNYSFTGQPVEGLQHIPGIPSAYNPTYKLTPLAEGYTADQPLVFTNAEYWEWMAADPEEHFLEESFTLAPRSEYRVYLPLVVR